MTQTEALKLALEALKNAYWPTDSDLLPAHNIKECAEAITAIKAALSGEAQTRSVVKDEPVVWNGGVPAMLPKQKEGKTFIVSYEPKLEAKDEPVATIDSLEQEIYENTRQFVSLDVMEWMLKRYYTKEKL